MRRLSLILVAGLALAAPTSVAAQRLAPPLTPWQADFDGGRAPAVPAAFGHPADYRWEGLIAGGLAGGVFFAYLASGLCGMDDSSQGCGGAGVVGFAVGAVAGGVTGGLIGGLISKKPRTP